MYIGCRKFDSSNCVRSRSILREKNAVFRLLAKIKWNIEWNKRAAYMAPLYIVRIKCSNVWLNIDVSRLRSRAFSLKQALCRPEKKRMQNKSAHTIYIKYSHFVCFECFVPCGDYGCLFVAFYGPLCIQWFWCVRVHISINSTKKSKTFVEH